VEWRRSNILCVALVLCSAVSCFAQEPSVLLRDVSVVTVDGEHARIIDKTDVLSQNGIFAAIGQSGTIAASDAVLEVEATGMFLIAGLADAHVHFDFSEVAADAQSQFVREPNDILCRLYVAHGVTFVRSMWGTPSIVELRDQLNAGTRIGPSMITTGPLLTQASAIPTRMLGSIDDIRPILEEHTRFGYDALKIHSSPEAAGCTLLVDQAAQLGIPVYGHVPFTLGLQEALDLPGLQTVEHVVTFCGASVRDGSPAQGARWPQMMELYNDQDEEKQRFWAARARESGKWICPTLTTSLTEGMLLDEFDDYLDEFDDDLVTASTIEYWRQSLGGEKTMYVRSNIDLRGLYEAPRAIVAALIDADARIIAGTDTPARPGIAGRSLHLELAEYVELGMTPAQALSAATVDVARALDQEQVMGRIAVGLRADAVLLRGNPLEDIANLSEIEGVLLRGEWLDRDALDALLEEARSLVQAANDSG
jgi:imidazolonepropionase-like amidohydrolase